MVKMTYTFSRWKTTVVLAFLLLVAGLACIGSLQAQLKESEVDFEVLATVVAQKGKDCCLWNMAAKYYGDPYKWSIIKDVNKIPNEKTISLGTVVYIPKLPLEKVAKVSEIDKLKKEISLLKKKNEDCANKLKKSEAANKRLAKQLKDCKAKKVAPKGMADCEKKVKALTQSLNKLKAENRKLKGHLGDIEEMEDKNRRLARNMKEKDEQLEEMEDKARRMRRDCEDEMHRKERRIEELEHSLNKLRQENEELRADHHRRDMDRDKHEDMHKREKQKPIKAVPAPYPCSNAPKSDADANSRSMIAAVAIAIVGSIVWMAAK